MKTLKDFREFLFHKYKCQYSCYDLRETKRMIEEFLGFKLERPKAFDYAIIDKHKVTLLISFATYDNEISADINFAQHNDVYLMKSFEISGLNEIDISRQDKMVLYAL